MAEPGYRGHASASFSRCMRSLTPCAIIETSRPEYSRCTQCSSKPVEAGRPSQQRATHLPHRNAEGCINARQRRSRGLFRLPRPAITVHLLAILTFCLLFAGALAEPVSGSEGHSKLKQRRRSSDIILAAGGTDNVDHLEPPSPPHPARMQLEQRQDGSARSTITVPAPTESTTSTRSADRTTTSATSTSSQAAATTLSTASLPTPFDTNLGNNFTTTCLPFFQSMLADDGFNECVPFSLLLQNSQGFFQAEKSLVSVTQVLDASCAASFDRCNNLMSSYAVQIKEQAYCGTDYDQGNPVVAQAYYGLVSYQTMYQAGCLKDSSGSYCFADAVTNSSSISDTYPYYLPLHMNLPGGARPTCDTCLQRTMQVFANAATNASQPVSSTYSNAAEQINIACGPNYVSASVQVRTGAAAPVAVGGGAVSLVALGAVLLHLLS